MLILWIAYGIGRVQYGIVPYFWLQSQEILTEPKRTKPQTAAQVAASDSTSKNMAYLSLICDQRSQATPSFEFELHPVLSALLRG